MQMSGGTLQPVSAGADFAPAPVPEPEVREAEPRANTIHGDEVRAWTVRLPAGRRTFHVGAYRPEPGISDLFVSPKGERIVCECTTAGIYHGYCRHGAAVARAIGGRDVVAEMWEALEHEDAGGGG